MPFQGLSCLLEGGPLLEKPLWSSLGLFHFFLQLLRFKFCPKEFSLRGPSQTRSECCWQSLRRLLSRPFSIPCSSVLACLPPGFTCFWISMGSQFQSPDFSEIKFDLWVLVKACLCPPPPPYGFKEEKWDYPELSGCLVSCRPSSLAG